MKKCLCVTGRERITADMVAILQRTAAGTKLHFLGMVLRFDEAYTRAFALSVDRQVTHSLSYLENMLVMS